MWEDKSRTIQQTDRRKGLAIHRNHCAAIYKNRRSVKKPEPESKDIRGNERKKTIWDWFQSVQCCGAAGPCESEPNRTQVFFYGSRSVFWKSSSSGGYRIVLSFGLNDTSQNIISVKRLIVTCFTSLILFFSLEIRFFDKSWFLSSIFLKNYCLS